MPVFRNLPPALLASKVFARLKNHMQNKLARVVDVFRQLDHSGDALLSEAELNHGFIALGLHLRADELRDLFRLLDENVDGMVSQQELTAALAKLGGHSTVEDVDDLFYELDPDHDGVIVFRELQQALIAAQRGQLEEVAPRRRGAKHSRPGRQVEMAAAAAGRTRWDPLKKWRRQRPGPLVSTSRCVCAPTPASEWRL